MSNIIAVICDCDDTLAPDTTDWLLKQLGIKEPKKDFWPRTNRMAEEGWNPTLAYMYLMVSDIKNGRLEPLTKNKFEELGPNVGFYKGLPGAFKELQEEFLDESKYVTKGIELEFYVISSGLYQLIKETTIFPFLKDCWGSEFEFDSEGVISYPKSAVSFTEKTRFVFSINKGLIGPEYRRRPFHVNKQIRPEARRVPFKNMIYLGDGPTDIPCLSSINLFGGFSIGVGNPADKSYGKTYELGFGRRCNHIIEPDYRKNSKGRTLLEKVIKDIANRIILEEGLKSYGFGRSY